MSVETLAAHALQQLLSIRDLTDPSQGHHAMQDLVRDIVETLRRHWAIPVKLERADPIVTTQHNYDRLRYPPTAIARGRRYTRYVDDEHVLRTQTSAMIPPLLEELARGGPPDVLLACPGMVYRRDAIDRLHTGQPHQLDLWRVRSGAGAPRLSQADLLAMVGVVCRTAMPGCEWRVQPTEHPYTTDGLQIDVAKGGDWVEIGECGRCEPSILDEANLPAGSSGLAMGLGLDRVVMLRKGLDDIRLLRASDPRIARQMLNLAQYRTVSRMPAARRDLSVAVDVSMDGELIGDAIRQALGAEAELIEEIAIRTETSYEQLGTTARERLGMKPSQKNVLLSISIRAVDRTLSALEANALRDRVYSVVHRGAVHHYTKQRGDRRM